MQGPTIYIWNKQKMKTQSEREIFLESNRIMGLALSFCAAGIKHFEMRSNVAVHGCVWLYITAPIAYDITKNPKNIIKYPEQLI